MHRQSRRLRLCALSFVSFINQFALAEVPITPQGTQPPVAPRSVAQPMLPTNKLPAKTLAAPRLLPPEITQPTSSVPVQPELKLTKFDPHAAEVRRDGRRWQLWSGKTLLKDFGEHRNDAFEARRLVAELKLSERGAIGTPNPVMEYWLSSGQAPPVPGLPRNVIPFDPAAVRVLEDNGFYSLGDERHVFFNFGPHAADAQQALAVIRKFEFNELGFIGAPEPSMTYLLKNATLRSQGPLPARQREPQTLPQQSPRHPLDLPGLGRVGERRPFDAFRMEIHKNGGNWRLSAGPHDLGSLGNNEYQARTAMQIAQRYPFTEYVHLGGGEFGFYLSNSLAPRGVPLGVRRSLFEPKSLTVKQAGQQWAVGDNRLSLATFSSADDARLAVKVIQHYGFNCICEVGPALKYLAQER